MANYKNGKSTKGPKQPQPDRTVFGTYVAPIFSSVVSPIAGQFTRRGKLFTGKNNTQTGKYSN